MEISSEQQFSHNDAEESLIMKPVPYESNLNPTIDDSQSQNPLLLEFIVNNVRDQEQGIGDRLITESMNYNSENESSNPYERPLSTLDESDKIELNNVGLPSVNFPLTTIPKEDNITEIAQNGVNVLHLKSESNSLYDEHQIINNSAMITLKSESLYYDDSSLDLEPNELIEADHDDLINVSNENESSRLYGSPLLPVIKKEGPFGYEATEKFKNFPALKKCSVLIERLSQRLFSTRTLKHSFVTQVKKRQLYNSHSKIDFEKECLQFLTMKKCSVVVKKLSATYISNETWKDVTDQPRREESESE